MPFGCVEAVFTRWRKKRFGRQGKARKCCRAGDHGDWHVEHVLKRWRQKYCGSQGKRVRLQGYKVR